MSGFDSFSSEDWESTAEISGYSAQRLADKLGISRRQLERVSRRQFGESPQRWLDRLRLVSGAKMLLEHKLVKSRSSTASRGRTMTCYRNE
jgi:AraC-like DNA-binding protein